MTNDGVSASTYNVRIISLRFLFSVTCGREEMKRYMQFHRKPRKLPIILSVEEVATLLAAVAGPGLKYRAALRISYPQLTLRPEADCKRYETLCSAEEVPA